MSRSSDAVVRATCSSALGLLLKSINSLSWRADRPDRAELSLRGHDSWVFWLAVLNDAKSSMSSCWTHFCIFDTKGNSLLDLTQDLMKIAAAEGSWSWMIRWFTSNRRCCICCNFVQLLVLNLHSYVCHLFVNCVIAALSNLYVVPRRIVYLVCL